MLEVKLKSVLDEVRSLKGKPKQRFSSVRDYFTNNEQNMVEDVGELGFLCTLPDSERKLITYPIIGNWRLAELAKYIPENEAQRQIMEHLMWLTREKRFNNSHTERFYGNQAQFRARIDEMHSLALANMSDAVGIHQFSEQLGTYFTEQFRAKINREMRYKTDPPHAILSPALEFFYLTFLIRLAEWKKIAKDIDATLMVVDDEAPQVWYERLISVGFKHIEGQQGFFYDCESALQALTTGRYDVILSDLELGKGKMGGVEFIERAYAIQEARGIQPITALFSYNANKLKKAQETLGRLSQGGKLLQDVIHADKTRFTALSFRMDVEDQLKRNN